MGPEPLPWMQGEVITMGTVLTLHCHGHPLSSTLGINLGAVTKHAGCMSPASLNPISILKARITLASIIPSTSGQGLFLHRVAKAAVGWAPSQHPPLRVKNFTCPATIGSLSLDVF